MLDRTAIKIVRKIVESFGGLFLRRKLALVRRSEKRWEEYTGRTAARIR